MKKFPILIVISLAILLTACAPQANNDLQILENKPELTPRKTERPPTIFESEIVDGQRRLTLGSGFSASDIQVYRGETLNIIYKPMKSEGETRITLEGLDVDATYDNQEPVSLVVKVKEVGDYMIKITDEGDEEQGMIKVIDFEKEDIFVNASVEEFRAYMDQEHFLLDVRTEEEFYMGHIEGATLIPLYELQSRVEEIAQYKDIPVLVYCRSGNRSITASEILIEHGFTHVVNLSRGFSAYQATP